ncbi:MAG: DUF4350 domain-containing protein [Pseudomonadota bacterium]
MSDRLPQATNPFAATLPALLIGFGTLLFTAIFVLLAWSPELVSKNRAGEHPYSDSALGFAGLVKLLEADGQTVKVSRLTSTLDYSEGPLLLTIPSYGFNRASDFDLMDVTEPALYVLPKWSGIGDREKPSWQKDTELLPREIAERRLQRFDSDATLWRLRNPGTIETPFGQQAPTFEHEMQVIESDSLQPVIDLPGGDLLVKVPGRDIYILSDPDVLNTFGLARRDNARFALSLIEWLKDYPTDPITLDATLHGFERSENLLRAIFDVPFLGATLIGFVTLVLVGWAGFTRLAPPVSDAQIPTFGKTALAESSAGLVSMARREGLMAPAYLDLVRRDLTKRLNLPRHTLAKEFAETADRLADQNGLDQSWQSQASPLAQPAAGRNELRDRALALWRWRQEIKNGN